MRQRRPRRRLPLFPFWLRPPWPRRRLWPSEVRNSCPSQAEWHRPGTAVAMSAAPVRKSAVTALLPARPGQTPALRRRRASLLEMAARFTVCNRSQLCSAIRPGPKVPVPRLNRNHGTWHKPQPGEIARFGSPMAWLATVGRPVLFEPHGLLNATIPLLGVRVSPPSAVGPGYDPIAVIFEQVPGALKGLVRATPSVLPR